uniref:Pentatricopeptide repeat-containing protein At5g66520 n=1 Tax=Anthurium amnicola TaxID=1678845 RepID=A0A1D1XHH6_9ARAE
MSSLSSCPPPRQVPPAASPPPQPSKPSSASIATFSSPSQLRQLHAHLLKAGRSLSALPLPQAALLCALSPSPDDFPYARRLLRHSPDGKPEGLVWNSCLKAMAESATPIDALRLFSRLRRSNLLPDSFACSFVLKACSTAAALPTGMAVHGLVEKLGLRSDIYLVNTAVLMYACCGAMDDARLLFEKMPRRDVVTWNIVITQLTKRGDVGAARELFDSMPERSVRSWTAMIAGYVQCGNPKEAICLFREMEEVGAEPNEVTVVAVLAACADLGALDLGKRVHEYSNQCGFQRNVRLCNTLMDMYIKCGCLELARKVFDAMTDRTVVSWSAMICGLAMHGQGEEALQLFSRMTTAGIRPNGVTFLGLLHACSHMGLLEQGRMFFISMSRDYGLIPEIEHYGSMVDLLSRAGRLQDALELIRDMPIAPNSVVWGALLGGARVHKNVEMGEEAIKHLRHLDPLNDGYYIVLSNIYAEAGRWEDVARVRRLMRDEGIKKTPGWSTVTLDGVVHEFMAGDSDHPHAEEIYRRWDELLVELKRRGYVPDTSAVLLDTDEDTKEHVLYRHSEKLALTFGLISTQPGTPIRIMKNLRVCSDCHAAFKLISVITSRQIIVRDRNRFHCFRDGLCSCRDYW